MKLFIVARGERTRSDDRWMHRWIALFNSSEAHSCRQEGGRAGGRGERGGEKYIKAMPRETQEKPMMKEHSEAWRQPGTLMSQTPKTDKRYTGRSCLTLPPPGLNRLESEKGKGDKSEPEYIREENSKAEWGWGQRSEGIADLVGQSERQSGRQINNNQKQKKN